MVSPKPTLNERLQIFGRHALVFALPIPFGALFLLVWSPIAQDHLAAFRLAYATGEDALSAFFRTARWFHLVDFVVRYGTPIVPLALTGVIAGRIGRDAHFLSLLTTGWISLFFALQFGLLRAPLHLGTTTEDLIAAWLICGTLGAVLALVLYLWVKSVYNRIPD